MTPRKVLAIAGLILIVPMIGIIRAQMNPPGGNTFENWSRIGIATLLVIVPAVISGKLWQPLPAWLADHRTANYYTGTAVSTKKTRQRALVQYKEITARETDAKHERERLIAIYEQAYREGLNAQLGAHDKDAG